MSRTDLITKWENNLQLLNDDGLEILDSLMGRIVEGTRYTTTNAEKLQQYHEKEAAEQLERDAKQARFNAAVEEKKAFEKTFLYDRNETMKILGKQCVCGLISKETEIGQQFDDVRSAHRYDWNFDVAIDMFSLGYIWGKRTDRARKAMRGGV